MTPQYVLHLLIRHPQYAQISPATTGIVAEVPVWYVLDRHLPPHTGADYAALPVKGAAIPVGGGAVRLPARTGHVTTQKRPTSRPERVAAYAW